MATCVFHTKDDLAIRRLRPVFGAMHPADIEPTHAYKYFDLVFKNHGFTSAKHDIGTLRHILTKAVQWGIITNNPLQGQIQFKKSDYGQHQRGRLVEDWEITQTLSIQSNYRGVKVANPYIRFKLMTGLRRSDIFACGSLIFVMMGFMFNHTKPRTAAVSG